MEVQHGSVLQESSISFSGLWGTTGFPWLTAPILHTQEKNCFCYWLPCRKVPILLSASVSRRLLVTLLCSLTERPSCHAFVYDSQTIDFCFAYCSCAFIHITKMQPKKFVKASFSPKKQCTSEFLREYIHVKQESLSRHIPLIKIY